MRKTLLCAVAGLFLWACTSETAPVPTVSPDPGEDEVDTTCLIPGEMVIEFSEEFAEALEQDLAAGAFLHTRSQKANEVLAAIGATGVERLYPDAGEWEPRHREAGLHRWYVVKFDKTLPQTRAVREISAVPGIVYAEPSRRVRQNAIFNDPYLPRQWHYTNDGTISGAHKAGCDINVLPVWRTFTGGKAEVIVAVIDGGIDLSHEDLAGVVMEGGANGSRNFVDGSYRITPHSHGTHVAGTIGAINNNGKGVAGVAGGLDGKGGVTLMSCQVFQHIEGEDHDASAGYFGDALVWAADHGAVIANNSWGNVYNSEEEALKGGVGSMRSAIDYFTNYAGLDAAGNQVGPMKGGLVLFSAGNESWKIGWPAAYEGCLAVGAVAPDYSRAEYSNYGDWVDIAAPGGDQRYSGGEIWSTVPGNKYTAYQGTSMACPHVAGVAALIVSQFGGQGFTNEMLKKRLLGGARQGVLSRAAQIGPLVDVLGAFSYGSTQPPAAVSSHSVSAHSNFLDFSWNAVRDPDDKIAHGYILLAAKDPSILNGIDLRNIPAGVGSAVVYSDGEKVGTPLQGTVSGLDFNTAYYTSIIAFDYSQNYSGQSPVVAVRTGSNTDPVIEFETPGDVTLKAHEVFTTNVSISDPDGHPYTVDFKPGSAAAEDIKIGEGSRRLVITGKDADEGSYRLVYTATDAFGASFSASLNYQILPNHPPVPMGNIENLIFEKAGVQMTLEMSDYISDPDGEQLVYDISSSPVGIVHLNQVEDELNLTTLDYGTAHVTITGTDVRGEAATLDLKVMVRKADANPDVYPSQVTGNLYVSDGLEKDLTITLSNSVGAVVYQQTVTCDAFSPAVIDMSAWAPGRYTVRVESTGKSYIVNIVKI